MKMNCRAILIIVLITVFCKAQSQTDSEFPYKLGRADWVYITTSCAMLGVAELSNQNIVPLKQDEILMLNNLDINSFDRVSTRNESENAKTTSNISFGILALSPALVSFPEFINDSWSNFQTISVMYAEAGILCYGITNLTKALVHRKRPYLYNSDISIEERTDLALKIDSYKSFFSGHSSGAFCAAVFLSTVYSDIYGRTKWSPYIWGGSLTLAALTGYLRIEAGMHYPTDVLLGAAIGSLVGYVIPKLHKIQNDNISVSISTDYVSIIYRF